MRFEVERAADGSDVRTGGDEAVEVDPDAGAIFHDAFVAHYRRFVGLASLLIDDDTQAEEIVQEAFASTWRRWDAVHERTEPVAYLRQAVINEARGRLRRLRSARTAGWRAQSPAVTVVDPVHSVETTEARSAVLSALGHLSARQRECVVLRFYGECSVAETALALGISAGAVKAHCHRALEKLAPLLEAIR